jgi:arsenite-transporting ATPase
LSAGPVYRFFGGKGGVGKTTLSAAAAVASAEKGRRVLAVSMDPAHSLGDALDVRLGARPRAVRVRRGQLRAAELDADAALARWLAARGRPLREIAESGTYLDRADVDRFLGLSVPGVDELMGLVELTDLAAGADYDEVVVDGAPTGHMLRLLSMPATLRQLAGVLDVLREKHRVLVAAVGGSRRRDEAEALIEELDGRGRALAALLRDPRRTSFTWVLLPEELSLAEASDGIAALEDRAMAVAEVVVNRVTPAPPGPCALCGGRRRAEAAVIAAAGRAWGARLRLSPARGEEPRGLAALRAVARALRGPHARRRQGRAPAARAASSPARQPWLDALVPPGVRLVLLGGKGGVGKTSAAAVVAEALSRRRRQRVLLLSADPAHSLGDVLRARAGDIPRPVAGARGLSVRELDAASVFKARRDRYRADAESLFDAIGRGVDASLDRAAARELLDLAPPGIDELFAILAVVDALSAPSPPDVVVVDTAPTGHALRLLALPEAARKWAQALLAVLLKYREVARLGALAKDVLALSRDLGTLSELIADKRRTAFVVVARPGELPRRETARLLTSLASLRVPVGGLIVNAVTPPGCARCRRDAQRDSRDVAVLRTALRRKAAGAPLVATPLVAPPPRGIAALRAWGNRWTMGSHAQGVRSSTSRGQAPRRPPSHRPPSPRARA